MVGVPGPEGTVAEPRLVHFPGDRRTPSGIAGHQFLLTSDILAPPAVGQPDRLAFSLARPEIPLVAVAVAVQLTIAQLDDVVGETVQQVTVMGDQHQRPAVCVQPGLQPAHASLVEVVGRLIEQQQVRPAAQGGGKRET